MAELGVRMRAAPGFLVATVAIAALCASAWALGCSGSIETLGAALAYEEVPLPDEQVRLDVPYRDDPGGPIDKHRLDLFLPGDAGGGKHGWTTVVFVHGGGWTTGDRAMGAFGVEPIRNLGRFLARRGYGVAVPSYRLQPGATWREQIDDVAAATAWVHREIGRFGGDPDAIHLAGHSAGAWLAAWVGLDDAALAAQGLSRDFLCSLVLVSGAGYDLEDERTYALGASREYFVDRFGATEGDWARDASIRFQIDEPVVPALLLTASGEPEKIWHQSDLLFETLAPRSPEATRVVVPGENHQRIMVSLSLEGDPASQAMLAFLGGRDCTHAEN